MTLKEVKEVCKELKLVYEPQCYASNDLYIYTQNRSQWIAFYDFLCEQAIIFNSDESSINDKDAFREGLKRKLIEIKEKFIKDRIKSLEKDFE
jgi:hypothetical protein